MAKTDVIPLSRIEHRITLIRGERVILDADLAKLYGVTTKAMNQQCKRNIDRFPDDFRFRLTRHERDEVVTNCDHLKRLRFSTSMPFAFTEHGTIMAANVLSSPQAVKISVFVVRAFVKLRETIAAHRELASKLGELEGRVDKHDRHIAALFEAIRQLMSPPPGKKRKPIGFHGEAD